MKQEVVTPGFAKKVENEIGTLNSKIANMEAKTITGKTPTTLNTLEDYSLPSGFTANNCTLIGHSIQNANNSEWYSGIISNVEIYLYANKLRIQIKDATWLNMDFKVLVMHFPT